MRATAHVYLLLGANLGDKQQTFAQARQYIGEQVGTIVSASSLYETEAWGVTNQPTYLNQVLLVETYLTPADVLTRTQAIEQRLGRIRAEKWGVRLIDIDLLFYDSLILNSPTLTLPHPLLHERRFTLMPLAELAPNFVHPVLGLPVHMLLANCTDENEVIKFS
ncbi:2-amino-4-hydroxy-6-hydroxymethyldihydropteridine diphosphokinase [Fibrivirga algicola]|uniref:2-amino-4-hydroxy-6-hydroxymethyldihydropteridine pyrophosphokinase n=1 Tax=Fibrivirga algicola TaxID=2950420 RepID=A0ABX0QJ34_9BACT|nr:2-amino-4-hydroxy-6-hydroxymethyldihydropteridine diphosphokinase [Fibrivirga algicola]ARK13558.1 2-amino-4-hydroxy-6-hydroxymethyldihydropteridine pyrophosphokinase [Fibrella sp. ES10-3-2-2]NID11843.1 2-amino-4-hydroxy-6-hydroxymethyldihydropteridine diphosphokinase [Fibrivirga algicola]